MNKPLFKKSDKIFLAGANGMVGSSIERTLKKYGYGKKEYGGDILKPSRGILDLTHPKNVDLWIKKNKPDITIIAAAKVGGILANNNFPADFLLENLKIQNNLIESSFQNGVRRLLFLGSSCIYPKHSKQPIREDYLLNGKLEQTNEWYAIAKIAGIKLCDALRKQFGYDAISLMPTNLYGPNDNYHTLNSHVIPALIGKFKEAKNNNDTSVKCWGTGSALREFMYVDDLAEAVIFCLKKWDPFQSNAPKDYLGNPLTFLNVGTGEELSIKELANLISQKIGFEGEILWDSSKPDGTKRKLLNIDNITNLGWKAKVNLSEGIDKTLESIK